MPMYEYRCSDCGEWQQAFRSHSRRDEGPDCLTCGSSNTVWGIHGATAGSKAPPIAGVAEVTPYVKGPGLLDAKSGRRYRLADRVCLDETCGHVDDTEEVWLDDAGEPAEPSPACSSCGGPAVWQAINPGHSRFSEVFPYYDEGAGRTFSNKRERREWMRRNNIEEAGDLRGPLERWARKDDDDERKAFAEYNNLRDRYRNDSAFRSVYLKLEDEGRGMPDLQ